MATIRLDREARAEPPLNGWASASCVTDGEVVVAFFGIGGIHAYTLDGKPLWSRDLGKFERPWGTAACPIIVDGLVIQNCDADTEACLVALDKRTGKDVWRTKRRDHRGWSTPIVIDTGKRREIVLNGDEGVQAYDPVGGRELWFCKSVIGRGEPTVTPAGEGLFVVNGLKNGEVYLVRPGGEGDVTSTHTLWHTPRTGRPRHAVANCGRRLYHRHRHGRGLHLLQREGRAHCLERANWRANSVARRWPPMAWSISRMKTARRSSSSRGQSSMSLPRTH